MFIAIEGLDAVGKTTVTEALAGHLGAVAMNTPGPDLRLLSDRILAALGDDQAARCLFYAASVLAQGRRARAIADQGGMVVMDRYWLSTVSYARARGVSLDLTAVERIVPLPDATLLLTLDEGERVRRLGSRGATSADIETLDEVFRETVVREMRSNARRRDLRPVEVDLGCADREEALRRVLSALPPRPRSERGRP